jgi:outer membrane receptor protein involved in Fe transport
MGLGTTARNNGRRRDVLLRRLAAPSLAAALLVSGGVQATEAPLIQSGPTGDATGSANAAAPGAAIAATAGSRQVPGPESAGAPSLGTITVTGTREQALLAETPISVGVIDEATIALDKPSHPAQIIGQVPGAAVAVTNGEGHTTAIRQPFTTSPVYLFLEGGIPTRATGFFNHNGLFEIDVPQSGGIEVTRGPGTALYGSDAIGGIINVLTREPGEALDFGASLEAGEHGWRRALLDVNLPYADGGVRGDLNFTETDGWRDATGYERQGGIFRWDHRIGDAGRLKTHFGFSNIDQQTGASSPLTREDFRNSPRTNYFPIAFRKVDAYRLNTTYEHRAGNDLFALTALLRDNSMDLLASFALNFDPTVWTVENQSIGLLGRWRRDLADAFDSTLIVGFDFDYSPGERDEQAIDPVTEGTSASRRFLDFSPGPVIYDYDVEFRAISPYVHFETSPMERLRLTAGLRYDNLRYEFDNAFDASPIRVQRAFPGTRFYGQVADTSVDFDRFSPKFGATWALSDGHSLYASYNHSFRAPSEGQLFRPSAGFSAAAAQALADSAVTLKPIKAEQVEFGIRGGYGALTYDAVAYELRKSDDIVTLRDTVTNFTQSVNAGETEHRGVEVGLGIAASDTLRLDSAFSYARHEYTDWVTSNGDFTGNDIESAPRGMLNTRLTWNPSAGARVQLEWVRIGWYWLDAANTDKYEGHDVFNLRGNWPVLKNLAVFASVNNLTDKRYADSAQIRSGEAVFSPALPRTFVGGLELRW